MTAGSAKNEIYKKIPNKFELLGFLDTCTILATIPISHAISKIKGKTGRLFVSLGWNARKLIGPL